MSDQTEVLWKTFGSQVPSGTSEECHLPRSVLFGQGEWEGCLYFVRSGQLLVSAVSSLGVPGVLAVVPPGGFVGLSCLCPDVPAITAASALGGCRVLKVPATVMWRMLEADVELSRAFTGYVVKMHVAIQERLTRHLFLNAEQRLARLLIDLCGDAKTQWAGEITPKPTHEMLAAMVGTTRPRVTGFMNGFRRAGMVTESADRLRVNRRLAQSAGEVRSGFSSVLARAPFRSGRVTAEAVGRVGK